MMLVGLSNDAGSFYLNKSWWCLHRRQNIYSDLSVWFFAEKGFLSRDRCWQVVRFQKFVHQFCHL